MTEAIWQLHYLFLLFFTPDLASAQEWKTHAQIDTVNIHHLCLNKIEISELEAI